MTPPKKRGGRNFQRLPTNVLKRLDDQGRIRGRNWRSMPGQCDVGRAAMWWLFKKGLVNLREEAAISAAITDSEEEEGLDHVH